MNRPDVLIAVAVALILTLACSPTPPNPNNNGNDNTANENDNAPPNTATRDFTAFSLFEFCAPARTCPGAAAGDLASAFLVDLRNVGFDFSLNMTVLRTGDPLADQCVGANDPCLVERSLDPLTLTVDDLTDLVATFAAVTIDLDATESCPTSGCDAVFCWAQPQDSSTQTCTTLSATQADAIAAELDGLRSDR